MEWNSTWSGLPGQMKYYSGGRDNWTVQQDSSINCAVVRALHGCSSSTQAWMSERKACLSSCLVVFLLLGDYEVALVGPR